MKRTFTIAAVILLLATGAWAKELPVSEDTEACLECHAMVYPGIVEDWKKSRMARVTPAQAMKKPKMEQRVSADKVSDSLSRVVVGCAECHTLNPDKHEDSFDHNGYRVHVVVTPKDCATCHPVERREYDQNLMAHAYGNLKHNAVYQALAESVNDTPFFSRGSVSYTRANKETEAESCLFCHGTRVTRTGSVTRETDFGEMSFPVLSGWPNQGVGRINPDGSKGSCSACHARHQFDMKMARKPYTCSECHKGPDVPAYPVYSVSKHGNIFASLGNAPSWNFEAVPWVVGKDFTAPTCAVCHVSLLISKDGTSVAKRTHRMNDRLYRRLFGLIYAHPHPVSPDTTVIRNKGGLPLPTELTGEPASRYLIDGDEEKRRKNRMQQVCFACHSNGWVQGHFDRFENTIQTTNAMTLSATKILFAAWDAGIARGPAQKDSIFNETIEKMWVEQWLFYANSTRFASAMAGADYGVFDNGRWYLSKTIQEMLDWTHLHQRK
ncbi:MAG: hydroxylamine oxidase [Deltaproteobacteria bacterium]|nr:hydroxylamine oxidase [Deltaproteobacteria bacterium]